MKGQNTLSNIKKDGGEMSDIQIERLVKAAKRKNADAFSKLIDSQMQSLYKTAYAILKNNEDAADAIQETILICWEKLPTLKKNQFFKTWITRILINECYKVLEQNKKIVYFEDEPFDEGKEDEHDIEFKEVLDVLDEKYRVVTVLYYSQGFSTKEISRILNIPDNTVRTRLSRAREQLKKYYEEQSV